jgi:transcriptional regulator with XRE-family HTH domain
MTERQRKTIRQLRGARGLTQFELAAKAGVSLSSVVNIEAGRQEPRVSLAEKIAGALGVSVGDIAWPTAEELTRKRPKEKPAA